MKWMRKASDLESDECRKVAERYERRKEMKQSYSILLPQIYLKQQEKERALIDWLVNEDIDPEITSVLEIGCGSGGNLLEFIRMGFQPSHLAGNELLEERMEEARRILPAAVRMVPGDACQAGFKPESFDVVLQSTVFTSILDEPFQDELASRVWEWVKPGGGVLWYDFTYDNPSNPDVRGVKVSRIRKLFPEAEITVRRLTLAPPIARRVTKIHPVFYHFFNMFPFFRTHVLCWIHKRND